MHNFKQLAVWEKAMGVAGIVPQLCQQLPDSERDGLVLQMRRAAVSVPSSIAEGPGCGSNVDFRRFLSIAIGSAYELETQLPLSGRCGCHSADQIYSSRSGMRKLTSRRRDATLRVSAFAPPESRSTKRREGSRLYTVLTDYFVTSMIPVLSQLSELQRMLYGLRNSLRD